MVDTVIPSCSVDHFLMAASWPADKTENTEYLETLADGHDHTEHKTTESKWLNSASIQSVQIVGVCSCMQWTLLL